MRQLQDRNDDLEIWVSEPHIVGDLRLEVLRRCLLANVVRCVGEAVFQPPRIVATYRTSIGSPKL